jgi:hypothetical protein
MITCSQKKAALVFAFDTLAYTKRLRDRGLPPDQAETARDFIMAELVTKADLQTLSTQLDAKFTLVAAFASV